MRLNVYSQELITDIDGAPHLKICEPDIKTSNTGVTYSAVRLFLHSSDRLHHPPITDDDRSAITFWLPQSPERREHLASTFEAMAYLVRQAPAETGLN